MNRTQTTKEWLLTHLRQYPQAQLGDVLKALHQSAFGCEHLLTDLPQAVARIQEEFDRASPVSEAPVQPLDGAFCRIDLSVLQHGLHAQTLGKLFFLSAQPQENAVRDLEEKLTVLIQLCRDRFLPFDADAAKTEIAKWKAAAYPARRHSAAFHAAYKPAYRVIKKEFADLLPLFLHIDKNVRDKRMILAVEGGSASGKSTCADLLNAVYGCTVLHMDDFFLQPHQRTPERFAEPGGNVDRERFLSEVLLPLSKNEPIKYRRFDCRTQTVLPATTVFPTPLTVVEGAYCMHPLLSPFYDFSVFMEIDSETQKQRILKRNGETWAQRFFNEWIPMEQVYFEKMNVKERCDLLLSTH